MDDIYGTNLGTSDDFYGDYSTNLDGYGVVVVDGDD